MSNMEIVYTTKCGKFWVQLESNRTEPRPLVSFEDALPGGEMEEIPAPDRYLVRGPGLMAPSLHAIRDTLHAAVAEADKWSSSSADVKAAIPNF